MTFEERTRQILQFDELIRRKHKADADGYARKLGMSRGSFFRLLTSMREEFQAPIRYEKSTQCYQYTRKGHMFFGFVAEDEDGLSDQVQPVKVDAPVADVVKQYLQRPGNRRDSTTS